MYEDADIYAIKALAVGKASETQQLRALKWIIESASMRTDQSFYPGDSHVTDFLEGRRSVGNQIVKLVNFALPDRPKVTNAP